MPHTTLIDAATGESRSFFLDCSFGCKTKPTTRCACPHWPVFEVRWCDSKHGEANQSRKFTDRRDAESFHASKKRKRQRPEWKFHNSGIHECY